MAGCQQESYHVEQIGIEYNNIKPEQLHSLKSKLRQILQIPNWTFRGIVCIQNHIITNFDRQQYEKSNKIDNFDSVS